MPPVRMRTCFAILSSACASDAPACVCAFDNKVFARGLVGVPRCEFVDAD